MHIKYFFTIVFLVLSVLMGGVSIKLVETLPKTNLTLKKNYDKYAIYSSIGWFLDVILSVIMLCFIPDGEYVGHYSFGVAMLVLLFYGIPCFVATFRLKKRWPEHKKWKNTRTINLLNSSVIFKIVLFFLIDLFLSEVC